MTCYESQSAHPAKTFVNQPAKTRSGEFRLYSSTFDLKEVKANLSALSVSKSVKRLKRDREGKRRSIACSVCKLLLTYLKHCFVLTCPPEPVKVCQNRPNVKPHITTC